MGEPQARVDLPTAASASTNGSAPSGSQAEEEWRRRTGRPMTTEVLERVLRRYASGR